MKKLAKFVLIVCVSIILTRLFVSQANSAYNYFFDTNFGLLGNETMVVAPALFVLFVTLQYSSITSNSLKRHILISLLIVLILLGLSFIASSGSPGIVIMIGAPYIIGVLIGRIINSIFKKYSLFGIR